MKPVLVLATALSLLPATAPMHSSPHAKGDATKDATKSDAKRDAKGDLVGLYDCQGMRPDGATYHGTVHIVRHNGTYHLLWNFGPGEQYVGMGIVSGDVMAVSYFADSPGLVAYRIDQAGQAPRLIGQWTVPEADGQVFKETLTRLTQDVTLPAPPPRPNHRETIVIPMRGVRPA